MIQLCQQLYSPELRDQLARGFAIEPSSLKALDGFSSFVYKGSREQQWVILKVSHSSWVSNAQLLSQLQFMEQLSLDLVPVPSLLKAADGAMLSSCPDRQGGFFFGHALEYVSGEIFEDCQKTALQVQALGRIFGQCHNCSERLHRAGLEFSRPHFASNDDYAIDKYLSQDPPAVRATLSALVQDIAALDRGPENFGLIHSDGHDGNIMKTERGLVLFDFSDCEYHYFLNDLAIALYTFFPPEGQDSAEYSRWVFQNLVRGYHSVRPREPDWYRPLPLFLKFRTLMLHVLGAKMAALTGANNAGRDRRLERISSGFASQAELLEVDYPKLARMALG